ncbi:hypothetical protein LTR95_010918, partial [Oleoguttula sp. CCFEE 5521]
MYDIQRRNHIPQSGRDPTIMTSPNAATDTSLANTGVQDAASSPTIPTRQSLNQGQSTTLRGLPQAPAGPQPTVITLPGYKAQGNGTKFFAPGRAFQIVQTDPAGNTGRSEHSSGSSHSLSVDAFGQTMYSKTRAFISVHDDEWSCRAVPITTYRGIGVGKKGVVKAHHCIVHTTEIPPDRTAAEAPDTLRNEAPMQPFPIRVDPDAAAGWRLSAMSRLNLAEERKVEHYCHVKNLGKINPASKQHFETQVQKVRELRFSIISASITPDFDVDEALQVLARSGLPLETIHEQIERRRT